MRGEILSLAVVATCGCSTLAGRPSTATSRPDPAAPREIVASTLENPEAHPIPIVVGVLPFRNDTADAAADKIGGALADDFSADLVAQSGVKVVERQRIKAALDELYFSDSNPVDEASAVKVGKLLGANVLALGNFSRLGKETLLTVRLVKVETGEVVVGATEQGAEFSDLHRAAQKAAIDVAARLRERL